MSRFTYYVLILFILKLSGSFLFAQQITPVIPENPAPTHIYVFYLHGGVVQEQGVNAVSQYYGKYEYLAILDTLSSYGFHVISEPRPKGTKEKEYALKVKQQVDTLLASNVPSQNIIIVGASQGAYIAMEAALLLQDPEQRYVLIGLCSEYALKYYNNYKASLYGNFLSVYERSDSKGSCSSIFDGVHHQTNFQEVTLNMGIDHSFLFKPYQEWVHPVVNWIRSF